MFNTLKDTFFFEKTSKLPRPVVALNKGTSNDIIVYLNFTDIKYLPADTVLEYDISTEEDFSDTVGNDSIADLVNPIDFRKYFVSKTTGTYYLRFKFSSVSTSKESDYNIYSINLINGTLITIEKNIVSAGDGIFTPSEIVEVALNSSFNLAVIANEGSIINAITIDGVPFEIGAPDWVGDITPNADDYTVLILFDLTGIL